MSFYQNLTWNGNYSDLYGNWSQQGCNVEVIDEYYNPPVVFTGMIGADGSLSGTYSGSYNGCWTATRISTTTAATIISPVGGSSSSYGE
jgi:hypothetical protein